MRTQQQYVTLNEWRDEVCYRPVESSEVWPPHTAEHPFCDAMDCPCHQDEQLRKEYLEQPFLAGLQTFAEGWLLFRGRQV